MKPEGQDGHLTLGKFHQTTLATPEFSHEIHYSKRKIIHSSCLSWQKSNCTAHFGSLILQHDEGAETFPSDEVHVNFNQNNQHTVKLRRNTVIDVKGRMYWRSSVCVRHGRWCPLRQEYLEACEAARSRSGCWGSCRGTWDSKWLLMMKISPHWLDTGLEGKIYTDKL